MSNINFKPSTIWTGDNLEVMRGMNDACIDLIYLDPPFNTDKKWEGTGEAEGADFWDRWRMEKLPAAEHHTFAHLHPKVQAAVAVGEAAHSPSMRAYLTFMAVRLVEMRRILKPAGSIYLHCDPTASHYLKGVMDAIFGRKNFRNEVIWGYNKPRPATKKFVANHDTLLFYAGDGATFNPQRVPTMDGKFEMRAPVKRPDGTVWTPKEPGKMAGSWWYDIPSFATRMTAKERCGYATQKPLALLDRIIKASSNPGDIVFDPFCGCATTLVSASNNGREWVGCDRNAKAALVLYKRLTEAQGETEGQASLLKDITATTSLPNRDDLAADMHGHPNDLPAPQATAAEADKEAEAKTTLFAKQRGICNGCGQSTDWAQFHVDHIKPVSKGGADTLDNKQLLCQPCNSSKSNKDMEGWREWAKRKYGTLIPFHGIAPRGTPREALGGA